MERRLLLSLCLVALICSSCGFFFPSEKSTVTAPEKNSSQTEVEDYNFTIQENGTLLYETPLEPLPALPEPSCPSCDDGNVCTVEYCNEDTGFLCVTKELDGPQAGCEGRSMEGECYEFTCVDGGCYQKVFSECCGNGRCELIADENYGNCPLDCPRYDMEADKDVSVLDGINNQW